MPLLQTLTTVTCSNARLNHHQDPTTIVISLPAACSPALQLGDRDLLTRCAARLCNAGCHRDLAAFSLRPSSAAGGLRASWLGALRGCALHTPIRICLPAACTPTLELGD
eukprot:1155831-Pelagomonas_calceolata.AAC.3